jgi:inorganic pyrophosphatase
MDEPAFTGCLVEARLIGVVEAEQTERDGKKTRNDRLVAVAAKARTHKGIRELGQLSDALVEEIEHFFVSYNEIKGKTFEPTGRYGSRRAKEIVEEGIRRFKRKRRGAKSKRG